MCGALPAAVGPVILYPAIVAKKKRFGSVDRKRAIYGHREVRVRAAVRKTVNPTPVCVKRNRRKCKMKITYMLK